MNTVEYIRTALHRFAVFLVFVSVFMALYPASSQARTNVAWQSSGGVATASSVSGSGYEAASANNGDRRGVNLGAGGAWRDGTSGVFPDWLQINFNATKIIGEISVFMVQDTPAAPVEPTATTTFTVYGLTAFQVQYWTGSAWADVPGGNITGNNLVWRKVTFAPISTDRIRVLVNAAAAGNSRITEVEAWTVDSALENFAWQSNGGVATASSTFSIGYAPPGANNGDRRGVNYGTGGGWRDGTNGVFPDWLQIDFNGTKSITEINVFTVQDTPAAPVEPTPTTTFTLYGITAFQVQYWNGTAWTDVPGGNVTGNNLVWRKFTFAPISTDKIRVLVNAGPGNSRITEVEAWGTVAQLYYLHPDHLNTPRVITNYASQEVWRWDNADPFGDNAPNENPSSLGNFTCNLRLPGQYFDKETNLHYNYFRDFDPAIGRYIQSDPIGLQGGINTYVYTNNPLIETDPFGLMGRGGMPTRPSTTPASEIRFGGGGGKKLTPQQSCYLKCRILAQPSCSALGYGVGLSFTAVSTPIGGAMAGLATSGTCSFLIMDPVCEQACQQLNAPGVCPTPPLPPIDPAASTNQIIDFTFR